MAEFVLEESEGETGGGDDFALIPEGEYKAEVVACEIQEKPWKDDDGNPVKKVSFRFAITEGEFARRQVFGDVNPVFKNHPNCRLYAWVQELFDEDNLPVGFKFDTAQMVGLPCRIWVGHYHSNKTNSKKAYAQDVMRAVSVTFADEAF